MLGGATAVAAALPLGGLIGCSSDGTDAVDADASLGADTSGPEADASPGDTTEPEGGDSELTDTAQTDTDQADTDQTDTDQPDTDLADTDQADAKDPDAAPSDADTAEDAIADAREDTEVGRDTDEDAEVPIEGWATGGTAAMTAKDRYPNPFTTAAAGCVLTCQTTLGPCHEPAPERQDISDGWDGIPVRLALRIVDDECNPIANAAVDVWHTNHRGSYSGSIPFCNETESDARLAYFRGHQVTDGNGRVDFDTCYPGWYPGRVVHFHIRVQLGGYDGAASAASAVTTQLFFQDALNDEIFSEVEPYSDFGAPDTTLLNDGVVNGEDDLDRYILETAKLPDGAMHAWKTVVVSTGTPANCGIGS